MSSIMRNYFELADTSNDRKVNENEVTAFLDSINIKLKKDQLKKLIQVFFVMISAVLFSRLGIKFTFRILQV
jgi:Ca2+-binding EF-hand superfamily protein